MTSPVFTPLQMFYSTSGLPLTDGYIYIGTASQNPQTNPIAVYWDAAGTIPAAQPIRTSGGYPVRNGSPATVFVLATDFSLIVRDKSSKLVFSRLSGNAFSAEWVTYTAAGTGAVATTVQSKLRESVSVFDFMTAAQIADVQANTASLDVTSAFVSAQTVGKRVYAPAGSYLLDNLRFQSGVCIFGDGYDKTIFIQKTTGNPCLNITSDATTGQLSSINLNQFSVTGKTGATVSAVLVYAAGIYAVWKSKFDFTVSGGYRALEITGATSTNVFLCDFKCVAVNQTATPILMSGCGYSTFDFFMSQCQNGIAIDEGTSNSIFFRLVGEGQFLLRGSFNTYNAPAVENIVGTAPGAGSSAIECTGSGQVLITPKVELDALSSAKVTYAFRPFTNTKFINPVILAAATLLHPFRSQSAVLWTLVGPGQNSCPNKIEAIYLDTNDSAQNLRTVSFVGDCSAFTSGNRPSGGKSIQYTTGTGGGTPTVQILNNTDAMIVDYSGTCTALYFNTPYFPTNGQVVNFYSRNACTALNWNPVTSGANVSLLPSTVAAGGKFGMIYNAANATWYPL